MQKEKKVLFHFLHKMFLSKLMFFNDVKKTRDVIPFLERIPPHCRVRCASADSSR